MGNAEPRLLLPFGGHVSNSLVEEQLRTTQDLRTFRVVAISSKGAVVRNLTSVEELAAIRRYKAVITLGMSHAEEHVPLDESIRYEIWSGDGPTAQPHAESSASGRATDYVYVVLSRVQSDEAILSVQSLHPAGLAAMSLFYSPVETLGSAAKTFREQALVAVKTNRSVGFEAVLRVERPRSSTLQETPRHFGGRPTLAGSTISLHTAPIPIFK